MFEKISLSITALLISMFAGTYYYQQGTSAPKACLELYKDYSKVVQLIDSNEYKSVARQLMGTNEIRHLHVVTKYYQSLVSKKFKRSDLDELQQLCEKARLSLNYPKIEQYIKHYKRQ